MFISLELSIYFVLVAALLVVPVGCVALLPSGIHLNLYCRSLVAKHIVFDINTHLQLFNSCLPSEMGLAGCFIHPNR